MAVSLLADPANRVDDVCRLRKVTHGAIARLLGISVNTYKSYEWGNRQPGGPSALKIIRLTGYPV